jgi:hypothetical protein
MQVRRVALLKLGDTVVWLKGMRSTTQKKFENFVYTPMLTEICLPPSLGVTRALSQACAAGLVSKVHVYRHVLDDV